MTPRERLMATMRGEPADRVPVAPFVQEEYLAWHYPSRPSVDRVIDAAELARELGFDLMAKHRALEPPHFLRRSYPGWTVARSEAREGDMVRRRLTIETPSRTLVQEEAAPACGAATAGVKFTVTRNLLQDADDVACFLEQMPPLDDGARTEMRDLAAQWHAVLGEDGVLAPWGWAGVFNVAAELVGLDNLYVAPYEDEAAYRALMDGLAGAMAVYNAALAEAGMDAVGIQGHLAGGASTGLDYFRAFVLPYERRVIEAIRAAGAFTVYHNCGCARALYPAYRELGITVWETVAPPPQGDNDLADAKAALGDAIVLLGNLDQVRFLKTADPESVAERTREIVRAGKPGGRYIFSTSDFLERDTPLANVNAMIAAAKEEGWYGR